MMKNYLISIWYLVDPIYYFCSRLSHVSCHAGERNIFRIKLTKYKGRNIILSDGTQINKNDLLVKIHLHNARLLMELKNIKSEIKKAKKIYYYVQNSLPGIDTYIWNHSKSNKIKGIIGISLLNKGADRLGFEVFDITSNMYKCFKWLSFMPIGLLSNQYSFLHILKHQEPKYLFMSAKKLSEWYRH